MFRVNFTNNERGENVIEAGSDGIGLVGLDKIRKETGVSDLKTGSIKHFYNSIYEGEITVPLSEQKARKANDLFDHQNSVRVLVSSRLDNFIREKVTWETNDQTGEVFNAQLVRSVDEDAIYEAWEAAGFPLVWSLKE